MTVRARFTRGAWLAFGLQLAALAVTLATQVALARALDQAAFGVYSQAQAALIVAANLLILGVPMTFLKLASTFVERGDWGRWYGLSQWGLTRVGGVSAAVGLAWAAAAALTGRDPAWVIAGLTLPTASVVAVQQTQALAFHRVRLARLPSEVARPGLALASFLVAVALGVPATAALAMAGGLVAGALTVASVAGAVRALPPADVRDVPAFVDHDVWRATSARFFGHGFFGMVLDRADVLVVGWLLGPREAAVYAVVVALGKLLTFALGAVNTVAAPLVSELHAAGRHREVREVLRVGVAAASAGAVATALPLALLARPVLAAFGEGYAVGAVALWITLAGYAINALCGSVGLVVGMAGHEHVTWRVLGAAAVAMVVAGIAVVPSFGIEGAAVARSVAMIGWNVALAIYARRALDYDPTLLALIRR